MKKQLLVLSFIVFFGFSLLRPVPASASFFGDIKNGVRDFWYEAQLKIPFVPKSAKLILWKMSKETDKAKTATMKMDLTAKVTGEQAMEIGFTMEAKPLEFQKKDGKSDMDATIKVKIMTQGVTVSGDGQLIQKGETTYFKLNEAPNLGFLDLSKLSGVWYRMPATPTGLNPTPTVISKDVENKINVLMKKELEGLMGKARKLDDQKIEGEDTYQIQIVLTKVDFARIINEIVSTMGEKGMSEAELAKGVESMNDVTVTLNVYKKNWYLANFGFSTKVQVDNPAVALQKMDVDMTLTFVLKDYNVPFTVTAPSGAKEFDPMSLYGGLGGVGAPAKDATGSAIPSITLDLPPGMPSLPAGYKLPSGY